MNLADRYVQYQAWKQLNPHTDRTAKIILLVVVIFLGGYIMGKTG